ncbi:hypothetical protein QQ045_014807 [Rhodiola kirilowii]
MEQFRQVLLDCGLMDLGFKGPKYTNSNKRQGREEVQCRLDRAVGDGLWAAKFPGTTLHHLVSHHSDHFPLLLNLDGQTIAHEKTFRFESMWIRDAGFVDMVNNIWSSSGNVFSMTGKLSQLS